MMPPHHVVLAYDLSATYSLKEELDAAPKTLGDFATFGDFQKPDITALWDEVESGVAHWPWIERMAKRYYIRGIRNRVLHGQGSPNPPCVALNTHLRILPNGDVPTCQFNTRKVGNLRRQSFREIWFGPEIAAQRDWVRKCPGCWAECEILPNAFYTGDLWRRQSQAVAPGQRGCPSVPMAGRIRSPPGTPGSTTSATSPRQFLAHGLSISGDCDNAMTSRWRSRQNRALRRHRQAPVTDS